MTTELSMDRLIERFIAWGTGNPNIRLMLVIGSQARAEHPADVWSDLDLIIVAENPQPYLGSTDWLSDIGLVRLTFLEPTPVGGQVERRVLFDGALDVDLSFLPVVAARQLLDADLPEEVQSVMRRGIRVLLDKDSLSTGFVQSANSASVPARRPDRDAFLQLVHDYLYHTIWTAKKLRRGELWRATTCCNCYMSARLLQMIELHTRVTRGWDVDTWYAGRFLESWADRSALHDLESAFAAYDAAELRSALSAGLTLFGRLAGEVAVRLGFDYPAEAQSYTVAWVEECLPYGQ
jgi:aminoglycoside 6-adenylyltransferase